MEYKQYMHLRTYALMTQPAHPHLIALGPYYISVSVLKLCL